MLSNLSHGDEALEHTNIAISSLVDTWILVKTIETNGERNRGLYVLKSRGMAHSNQIREFVMGSNGIELVEPYVGPEGVLTGTARLLQESRDRLSRDARRAEVERAEQLLERRRVAVEQQIAALQADFDAERAQLKRQIESAESRELVYDANLERMGQMRGASPQETQTVRQRASEKGRRV
jgi:circadian clock protein KaiC